VSDEFVAHLASDGDPRATACGEPWQGWQEPENPDRENYGVLPPHDQPRPRKDRIRQCQACLRVAASSPTEKGEA
jgi:hypothetical protein